MSWRTALKTASNYHTFDKEIKVEEAPLEDHVKVQLSSKEHEEASRAPPESLSEKLVPAFLLISASLMSAGMHGIVRYITSEHHVSIFLICFFRSILQTILSCACLIGYVDDVFAVQLSMKGAGLLIGRGIIGTLSVMFHYSALARLPVAVATALFTSTPIFASLLGALLLREKLGGIDQVALLITSLGTFLVGVSEPAGMTPGAEHQYVYGVVYALGAAASTASVYVLMRVMGTRVHFILSVFTQSVCSVFISWFVFLVTDEDVVQSFEDLGNQFIHVKGEALRGLVAIGILGFLGDMLQNRGSQLMSASSTALIRSCDIPINFVVGVLLLGEVLKSPLQITGCCLIAVSTYLGLLGARRS